MQESTKRTIARTATYRVICTATIFTCSILILGRFWDSVILTVTVQVIQTFAYFLHERAWLRIRWGTG